MFCDEPILNVYHGREESDDPKGSSFFDAVNLVYHVTPLLRIVLETEHWAITINANGVHKEPRENLAEQEGEWLEETVHISEYDDMPWIEYENTLFVDERLVYVRKDDREYLLEFDDFSLRVIPYELGELDERTLTELKAPYQRIKGCDRLLKRTCDCGGTGKIMMDFVSDYFVLCNKCDEHTWSSQCLYSAINDWNDKILADESDET